MTQPDPMGSSIPIRVRKKTRAHVIPTVMLPCSHTTMRPNDSNVTREHTRRSKAKEHVFQLLKYIHTGHPYGWYCRYFVLFAFWFSVFSVQNFCCPFLLIFKMRQQTLRNRNSKEKRVSSLFK